MKRLQWSSAARIAVIGLLATGCGEVTLATDAGTDAAAAPDAAKDPCRGEVAQEDAWECMVDAFCQVITQCYGDVVTVEECRELDFEVLELDAGYGDILLDSALEQETIRYDGAVLGECMEQLDGVTCEDLIAQDFNVLDACRPYIGTVQPDGACYLDLECMIPGSRCLDDNCGEQLCCPGTCVAPAAIEGDCTTRPCVDGAYCVDGVCLAGSSGARCLNDGDCDENNFCENGRCRADRATGEPCTDDDMCTLPEVCLGDDLEGSATGVCGRAAQTGDPCDGTCVVFMSHWCDQPDPTVLGTCRPRLSAGESCDPEQYPCQFSYECNPDTMECEPPGGPGASCEDDFDCDFSAGLHCTASIDNVQQGTCEGPLPDGDACDDNEHCTSGYCAQGICTPVTGCY